MNKYITKEFWLRIARKKFFSLTVVEILGISFCAIVASLVASWIAVQGWLSFLVFLSAFLVAGFIYFVIIYVIYNFILK